MCAATLYSGECPEGFEEDDEYDCAKSFTGNITGMSFSESLAARARECLPVGLCPVNITTLAKDAQYNCESVYYSYELNETSCADVFGEYRNGEICIFMHFSYR